MPYDVDDGQTMKPGRWNDITKIFSSSKTFKNWNNRDKPCPGTTTVSIEDTPYMGALLINYDRELFIKITVFSGAGCPCAKKWVKISAKQRLAVDKDGNIKAREFKILGKTSG